VNDHYQVQNHAAYRALPIELRFLVQAETRWLAWTHWSAGRRKLAVSQTLGKLARQGLLEKMVHKTWPARWETHPYKTTTLYRLTQGGEQEKQKIIEVLEHAHA